MTDRPDDLLKKARAHADLFEESFATTPSLIYRLADALEAAQKERDEALVAYRTYKQVAKFHTARGRQLEEALGAAPEPNNITERGLVLAYVKWFHGARLEAFQVGMRQRFEAAREVLAAKENTTEDRQG